MDMQQQGGGEMSMPVESASPISSRPPASEQVMRFSGEEEEEEEAAAADRAGGRWPRQQTLALLKIRSEMDAAFRDASVKGPLWEQVSRKLAELGYSRSAKKCKEKFENVQKYHKRTKEGRQHGKSYKFFSQLEAFHHAAATTSTTNPNLSAASLQMPVDNTTTTTLDVSPVSVGIPMPIPSDSPSLVIPTCTTSPSTSNIPFFPPNLGGSADVPPRPATTTTTAGISFSSYTSSSSPETDEYNDEIAGSTSRKRKRQSASSTNRMMEFLESLMKQVMQKQEAMQQKFLEVIEKSERERMIREEAWKRQETARLAQDHELMAQERAISASRDAAIISFLQKITGQTIQLPSLSPSPIIATPVASVPTPSPSQQAHHHQKPLDPHHQQEGFHHHPSQRVSQVGMTIPEQQEPPPREIGTDGERIGPVNTSTSSSRWPKAEVLALIKLRSELEFRYQEAEPKGPLWEEISAGMHRMGFNRSAKRCKEKWENINKYFKKVKDSNKKRPEDAKTCPYFHELDSLYRKRIVGGTSSSTLFHYQQDPNPSPHDQATSVPPMSSAASHLSENKNVDAQSSSPTTHFGEGSSNKPEDIVKELMIDQQGTQLRQSPTVDSCDKIKEPDIQNESDSDDMNEEDSLDEDDEEMEKEEKINAYKIDFQTATSPNGNANEARSFMTMVQ